MRAHPGLGEVHDLLSLRGVALAESAAEEGEVLREDEDLATADRSPARHDAVRERAVLLDAEPVRAVPSEHVELAEGPRIGKQLEPLAREQLASLVLALDRLGAADVQGLVAQLVELLEALLDRVRDRRYGCGRPAFAVDFGIFDCHGRQRSFPAATREQPRPLVRRPLLPRRSSSTRTRAG